MDILVRLKKESTVIVTTGYERTRKMENEQSVSTHVILRRGLPVLSEGLRRHLDLYKREPGFHPLGAGSPFGADQHPLPIPPEPCSASSMLKGWLLFGERNEEFWDVRSSGTCGCDGCLGHGDAPARLDWIYEDGFHRRCRCCGPPDIAAGEDGGQKGCGLLHWGRAARSSLLLEWREQRRCFGPSAVLSRTV